MAKDRRDRKAESMRGESGRASAAAVDEENGVSDVTYDDRDEERYAQPVAAEAAARGFFDIYKPGQGFYTRVWSGIGFGALVVWFAYFLYEKLSVLGHTATTRYIQFGVATATIVGFGLLTYWLLALNRRVSDFLIATESEMKKVHWTSRREIIGSTKVVIFVMIALSVLLFVVDLLFLAFFSAVGVLKGGGVMESIKGLF
jgi:preprotein translocase SecE subunit